MQHIGRVFQGANAGNFSPAQHAQVSSVHNCYDADDGFKHLQAHVASAAYASRQDGDAPKCHPETRTAILNTIMDWLTLAVTNLQWILWVNGAAGSGKSAIARSVVDLCLKRRIIIAHFFFFRTDSTRNTTRSIVATLVYQLIRSIPALDSMIVPKIRSDPLIFNESLETQFEILIFEPLRQLHREAPLKQAIVFLLDGVDECARDDHQVELIHIICQFVAEKTVPLTVIFSSRTEPQLQMAFNSPKIDNILRRIPLDSDYRASHDIRLFLDDSFTEIKTTHMFKSSIPPTWPTPSLVQQIVSKSSGQFIYASVVRKFISSPRYHPVQQLDIVCGLRPAGALTPFAQLDALYLHIFSQVQDIDRVTAILAIVVLSDSASQSHVCAMLDIAYEDVNVALVDLTSVISCRAGKISFLHASLPDFLLDQSRGKQYYIDKGRWAAKLAEIFLGQGVFMDSDHDPSTLAVYLTQARCTPQLQRAVSAYYPYESYFTNMFGIMTWVSYIDAVQKMDFGDGGQVYRRQLNLVVRLVDSHFPTFMHDFSKHDIVDILRNIAGEKAAYRTKVRIQNSGHTRECLRHYTSYVIVVLFITAMIVLVFYSHQDSRT